MTPRPSWPVLAGAALGAAFFFWIAGTRVINPTEVAWAMQLDWHWHFLGWHFFRHEPWHLPPGRIDGYLAPIGTAVGFTDSIPLAALLLKPFVGWLPPAFQYLGLWMLACFTLQGAFGVLLLRLWTSSVVQQLLGAACFVLVPTLLTRVGHPALCSHWLLLWALWLYFRAADEPRAPIAQSAALGLVVGLVHPYLAAMVLAIVGAMGVRLLMARQLAAVAVGIAALGGTVTGWWLSGLFGITGAENLASIGISQFSMNLLGPITPTGWSTILPELPIALEGQAWEGFQYLGLGLLALVVAAIVVRIAIARPRAVRVLWPLLIVAALFAIYSLSPRVTFGSTVLFDVEQPWMHRFAFFRATGRFFWPTTYVILALSLSAILSRLSTRAATALLCAVVALQLVDLREAHAFRRGVARAPEFHAWKPTLASPAWHHLLPNYKHVLLYPPSYCGGAPVDLASIGYLAGLHGLTLNSGLVARVDEQQRLAACRQIADAINRGDVDDANVYLGRPGEIDVVIKRNAQQPVVCGVLDNVGLCVTARSYEAWRHVAALE